MLCMLCVDSDVRRLKQLISDLRGIKNAITLLQASSSQQAKDMLDHCSHDIAVIISAQTLSDGDALSLFSYSTNPRMRKLIYADLPCVDQLIKCINQKKVDHFICLPYTQTSLINTVRQQAAHYEREYSEREINTKHPIQTPIAYGLGQEKFLDFSLYSDQELSDLVILSLQNTLKEQQLSGVKLRYKPNHILTREGEHNRFIWFMVKGKVALQKRNVQGATQDITTMGPGSMIGGMSFLTEEKSFSTGITLTDTEVIKVDKFLFSKIMQSNFSLLAPFTNLLLRNFNRRLQDSISTELALQEVVQSLDAAYLQLLESEKMAVLGQLVAGVAHELNNPIAAILRGSETLIALIPKLLADSEHSPFSKLATQTLSNGLTIRALSTAEVRKRAHSIADKITDKNLAKKLVNMQLEKQLIPLENELNLSDSIELLDNFHQAGTILRNSNACANRIANLVQSLKHYAGHDSKEASMVNIHDGLEETLIIFESRLKHYTVVKNYQVLPAVECYPIELEQVWTNILSNAIDATGKTGELILSTKSLPDPISPKIQLIFEDNGPGIKDDTKHKIFELNYTTKRKGNFGLGIGLTISSQIIKRHQGTIHIEDGASGGSRFIITLPIKKSVMHELKNK